MNLSQILSSKCNKDISTCTNEELYFVLLEIVQELGEQKVKKKQDKKKLYYISAEFLIGKLLSNNLINLGIYDEVKKILAENGKNLSEVEEVEPEPSLGNGGLGRLAACFLDSIATLGLPGDGIGLNYHLGLFKQVFKNNLQTEEINEWINNQSWLNKTDITYDIDFGDFSLKSRLYDIYVIGYNNVTNKLHLFDVETVDEGIVKEGIKFDKENVEKNLTLFLYPDDSDEKGHLLRIYQQYFMVSNGARFILDECISKGCNLHDLYDYAVIQINDTHPTMVIPELIRLLVEKGIEIDEAIEIVSKTCAYTNHTILAEALEKWPIAYLEKAVPQLVPIIKILDEKVREKYDDESFYIIDKNNNVIVINESHDKLSYFVKEPVNCVCYNLGYLPGGDKNITTLAKSSLSSIKQSLELITKNGIVSIAIYRGHNEGKEEENCIINFAKTLPKNKYGVMLHECINRSITSPLLMIIEKK